AACHMPLEKQKIMGWPSRPAAEDEGAAHLLSELRARRSSVLTTGVPQFTRNELRTRKPSNRSRHWSRLGVATQQSTGFDVRMRQTLLLILFHLVLAVAAAIAWPSNAQQGQGPCQQVREACRTAGFEPGGAKGGAGILIDCIRPIMQGIAQRPKATKPIPEIDANVVQACRAANPSFGQQETPAIHELSTTDLEAFFGPLIKDQLTRFKIAGAVA